MGWFDGASDVSGHHRNSHYNKDHHHSHISSRPGVSRTHSTSSIFSAFGGDKDRDRYKHDSSARSIFGSGSHHHNCSRASFFGFSRSSSYRRSPRSPRSGYLKRLYLQLRRLLRDLMYYMKRHPLKVFVLVIMPLLTGGALSGLLRQFGIRMPAGLDRMFGGNGKASSIGRGSNGGMQWERTRVDGPLGSLGGLGGIGGAVGLAKMFV